MLTPDRASVPSRMAWALEEIARPHGTLTGAGVKTTRQPPDETAKEVPPKRNAKPDPHNVLELSKCAYFLKI